MVRHMRYCTNMEKGDPYMADIALNCKKEVRAFRAIGCLPAHVHYILRRETAKCIDAWMSYFPPPNMPAGCVSACVRTCVFIFLTETALCAALNVLKHAAPLARRWAVLP